MSTALTLSKSRFTSGLQCHRQLWWKVHEPKAPELVIGRVDRARMDEGAEVGRYARRLFAGGTLIDEPYWDQAAKLAATRAALATDTPAIYEAAFTADDLFVAVDILERELLGWRIIEVKSALSVKDEHITDAAIQLHVLRRAGIAVTGVDAMVLNRECTYPDLSNLFLRVDVTAEAEARLPDLPRLARAQIDMLAGPLPVVPIGPHCRRPRDCPFLARCWPEPLRNDVSTLYKSDDRQSEFAARGWRTIDQLPDGLALNPQAERQRRAVIADTMIVEGDLAADLRMFDGPLAYLDFETVQPAIPRWNGCHPRDQVAAQFSCHRELPSGRLEHQWWITQGPADPRPELARRVIESCRGARAVVAYYAEFERARMEEIAAVFPEYAEGLRDVISRLVDPLPVIREHIYHPQFGGRFGLKYTLPALVPDLSYDGLVIAEGMLASLELTRIVLDSQRVSDAERGRLLDALEKYCERDTLAMVRLVERLRGLVAVRKPAGPVGEQLSFDFG